MNCFKHILSVFFITALAVSASHAQTNLTMKNVSVINEQGHVRLNWEYDGTEDLVIFRDSLAISSLSPIDTIYSPSIKSYIDKSAKANINPRLYKIQSATTPNDVYTQIISTYILTFEYDSCATLIELFWTELQHNDLPENQWTPSKFIIQKNEEGSLEETTIDASNNSFSVNNIKENTNYTFKIGVEWEETDSTGFSNPVSKFTEMPQSPDYIKSLYATAEGNNTHLKFEIAPNSELSNYKLLKSNTPTGNYDTLETITTNDFEITTLHENSNPHSEISYYKLVAENNCGNITTQSDFINNIRLEVENEDYTNSLQWNLLKEIDLVDVNYEIYRIAGDSEPELIRSFLNRNKSTDNIESFQGEGRYGSFCYFIRAYEAGSSEYSQSNIACVYLEPQVFIPEAFTPNDDGKNDIFKPVFSFLPADYQLIIYNRWSNVVFQTNDPEKGWNGKSSNGKPLPTGNYIYYLKIKTPGNQIVEKRGNITIFYP